jgi:hypothetical protein
MPSGLMLMGTGAGWLTPEVWANAGRAAAEQRLRPRYNIAFDVQIGASSFIAILRCDIRPEADELVLWVTRK